MGVPWFGNPRLVLTRLHAACGDRVCAPLGSHVAQCRAPSNGAGEGGAHAGKTPWTCASCGRLAAGAGMTGAGGAQVQGSNVLASHLRGPGITSPKRRREARTHCVYIPCHCVYTCV